MDFFIVPPIIRANGSNYIATVGAEVMLKCNIFENGIPRAEIEWKRNGIQPRGELVVDNSFTTIKLHNLTMKDAGKYTCTASNVRSYRSDLLELTIIEGEHKLAHSEFYEYDSIHTILINHNIPPLPQNDAIVTIDTFQNYVSVIATVFRHFEWGH